MSSRSPISDFFSLGQFGPQLVTLASVVEQKLAKTVFVTHRIFNILQHPIADFTVRDGCFHNGDKVVVGDIGQFQPLGIKALT